MLASEPLIVAVPAGHPLSHKASIDLAALADEPMVTFTPHRSPLYGQVLGACWSAGFQPRVVQEATHIMTIIGQTPGCEFRAPIRLDCVPSRVG